MFSLCAVIIEKPHIGTVRKSVQVLANEFLSETISCKLGRCVCTLPRSKGLITVVAEPVAVVAQPTAAPASATTAAAASPNVAHLAISSSVANQ